MNLRDLPIGPPRGARPVAVERRRVGAPVIETRDWVAEEVPVALEFNGISHAVMLATPTDLEDFAIGFSLTEDIVDAGSDVRDVEVIESAMGMTVRIEVASSCFHRLKERRRNLTGRTGCGLCGTESLEHAVRPPPQLGRTLHLNPGALRRATDGLRELQRLHEATGATHAAALADEEGRLLLVREDVGRHNALDKLVGAMLRHRGLLASRSFAVVTSRASYEMTGKTARAGIELLAAVSGVTALAIDVAEAAALTLVGFTRGGQYNVYAHPVRVPREVEHGI